MKTTTKINFKEFLDELSQKMADIPIDCRGNSTISFELTAFQKGGLVADIPRIEYKINW